MDRITDPSDLGGSFYYNYIKPSIFPLLETATGWEQYPTKTISAKEKTPSF